MPDHPHDPFDPFGDDANSNQGGAAVTTFGDASGLASSPPAAALRYAHPDNEDEVGGENSQGEWEERGDGADEQSGGHRRRQRRDYNNNGNNTESPGRRDKSRTRRSKSRSPSRHRSVSRSHSPTGQSSRQYLGGSSAQNRKGKRPVAPKRSGSGDSGRVTSTTTTSAATKSPGGRSREPHSGGDRTLRSSSSHQRSGRRPSQPSSKETSRRRSRNQQLSLSSSSHDRSGGSGSFGVDSSSCDDNGFSGDELSNSRHHPRCHAPTTPRTPRSTRASRSRSRESSRISADPPAAGSPCASSPGSSFGGGMSPPVRKGNSRRVGSGSSSKPGSGKSWGSSGSMDSGPSLLSVLSSPPRGSTIKAGVTVAAANAVRPPPPNTVAVNYNDASVWELRARFQREFPDDLLPSDLVLRTLYSPDKVAALARRERFQGEHPTEPVPSDEVLRRLYDVVAPAFTAAASALPPPAMVAAPPMTEIVTETTPPPPILHVQTGSSNRRDMMARQDSGLTFATEAEWEHWKASSSKGNCRGKKSNFGVDSDAFVVGIQGIVEDDDEDEVSAKFDEDGLDATTQQFFTSVMEFPSSTSSSRKGNPSLDVLKMGKAPGNKKASSQSLGSYNDKSLSRSVHSVSKTAHSRTIGGNRRGSRDALSRSTHSSTGHNTRSSKSSSIDLLNVPSDHFYEKCKPKDADFQKATGDLLGHVSAKHTANNCQDDARDFRNQASLPLRDMQDLASQGGDFRKRQEQQQTAADFDPFQDEAELVQVENDGKPKSQNSGFDDPLNVSGNESFGSMNSRGERQKRTNPSKKSSSKKDKEGKTKKKNSGSSGDKKKSADEGSLRQSRTAEVKSRNGKPPPTRGINRAHSDVQDGKADKKTTKLKRTKSGSAGFGPSFDFDCPPTFGFDAPNAFNETIKESDFETQLAAEEVKEGRTDFFEMTDSTWNQRGFQDAPGTPTFPPSKKERRRVNLGNSKDSIADKKVDYFGDSFMKTAASSDTRRPGVAGGNIPTRKGRRANASSTANSGWMSEMPGHVRQTPAQEQHQSEGFELRVQGDVGAISPLTACTKKPVRPVIRNRW